MSQEFLDSPEIRSAGGVKVHQVKPQEAQEEEEEARGSRSVEEEDEMLQKGAAAVAEAVRVSAAAGFPQDRDTEENPGITNY